MKYYAIVCILLVTSVLVLDILRRKKSRKQVNVFKYKVSSWSRIWLILVVVMLLISSAGSLISYFHSNWEVALVNAYIFLAVGIQFSFLAFERYYICDTGIWYSGRLFKWDEVESIHLTNERSHIVIKMKKKFLGMDNSAKFLLSEHIREEVISYITNHIRITD